MSPERVLTTLGKHLYPDHAGPPIPPSISDLAAYLVAGLLHETVSNVLTHHRNGGSYKNAIAVLRGAIWRVEGIG